MSRGPFDISTFRNDVHVQRCELGWWFGCANCWGTSRMWPTWALALRFANAHAETCR